MANITHKSLEEVIINQDRTIRDAMQAISTNCLFAVLVVDDSNHLLGTLTDGDIRAGILKNVNLDMSVRVLMNTNPTVLEERKTPEEVHKIMLDRSIMIIPLVNDQGQAIDYYHLREINDSLMLPCKVVPKTKSYKLKKNRTVLVIGGAGYIGSVLVRRLLDDSYKVIVLDSLLYGEKSIADLYTHSDFELIRGDVRNTEVLMSALKDVDSVIHLGEIVGDPACSLNDNFTVDVNFMATKNITEICLLYGIRRLIFASSCSVYGISDRILSEESDLNPVSLYARCKIESERVILSHATDNFSPTILRLATVFGASNRPRFDLVVNLLTAKAILDGEISLFGGKQWRPFVSVKDVVRAITCILKSHEEKVGGQIFNVGADHLNFRISEIGQHFKQLFPNIRIVVQDDINDTRSYHVNFSKIKKSLKFECETDLRQGIMDLAHMIKEQKILDYNYKYYHNYLTLAGNSH